MPLKLSTHAFNSIAKGRKVKTRPVLFPGTQSPPAIICTAFVRPADGIIRYTIPGACPGKVRMTRSDKWAKRPCVVRYMEWRNQAKEICKNIPPASFVAFRKVTAYYTVPKSWSGKKKLAMIGNRKRSAPDGDNVLGSVDDALWPDGDQELGGASVERFWATSDYTAITIELEAE